MLTREIGTDEFLRLAMAEVEDIVTVEELVEEYLENVKLRGLVNRSAIRKVGLQIIQFCGSDLVEEIDTHRLLNFQRWLRESYGYGPGTINLKVRQFRAMLRFAMRNGYVDKMPECPPRLKGERPRQGVLHVADFIAIVAHLPRWAADVFEFAFFSGWRRNEILDLTWDEVDLAGGAIRLDAARSKTRQSRICPLIGRVREVITRREEQRLQGLSLVFHRDGVRVVAQTFYMVFRPACAKAGRPGVLLHDCRRSCVTALIRAGVPERIAMQLTGHRSRSVFDRYNIVSQTDLVAAAHSLDRYIFGVTSENQAETNHLTEDGRIAQHLAMNAQELRQHLERLDVSGAQLSERVGVHRATVNRWVNGVSPIPHAAAVMIRNLKPKDFKAVSV